MANKRNVTVVCALNGHKPDCGLLACIEFYISKELWKWWSIFSETVIAHI